MHNAPDILARTDTTMKPTTTATAGANIEPGEFGAVYHQRFAVEYDYPVHFTQDLFARDNPVFVSALARKEPNKRHRFVVFIDADVAASWPALAHDIAAYAEHHADAPAAARAPPRSSSAASRSSTTPSW